MRIRAIVLLAVAGSVTTLALGRVLYTAPQTTDCREAIDTLILRQAKIRMARLALKLDEYRRSNGDFPATLSLLPGSVARDPWDREFRYEVRREGAYDLSSAGKDGRLKTVDDIYRTPDADGEFDTLVFAEEEAGDHVD